jgi:hypothetical protein
MNQAMNDADKVGAAYVEGDEQNVPSDKDA